MRYADEAVAGSPEMPRSGHPGDSGWLGEGGLMTGLEAGTFIAQVLTAPADHEQGTLIKRKVPVRVSERER